MKTYVKVISVIMTVLFSGPVQASMFHGSDFDPDRYRGWTRAPAGPDQQAEYTEKKTGSINEEESLLDEDTAPAGRCGKLDGICVGTYAIGGFLVCCLGVIVLGVVECTFGVPFPANNCTGGIIPWGIP